MGEIEENYQRLEADMLKYVDLAKIPVIPDDEPMVPLIATDSLAYQQIGKDMKPITGNEIYVRETVATKLGEASLRLAREDKNFALQVVYGYRALSVQTKLFEKFKQELSNRFSGDDLLEEVHKLIAVPSVAGHPTGGAIDVQIIRNGKPLDFGTDIWTFDRKSYTYSNEVSNLAMLYRFKLRHLLKAVGFAPFNGEWWHFSYGDKEWAAYYEQSNAIYDQIEFSA